MPARLHLIGLLLVSLLSPSCSDSPDKAARPPKPKNGAADTTPYTPTLADVDEHNRGVALMGRFDYAAAHKVFAELFAAHPNWLDVKVDLAIATLNRQKEGDSAAALKLLSEAAAADPANLRARYCTAILQYYQGRFAEAQTHFQAVAKADPDDAYAAYFVGVCHFENGDYDAALQWYDKAMSLDGYLRSAYYGASQAARLLGRTLRADELLALHKKLEDNPQARNAEIKYTRMGPKAEIKPIDSVDAEPVAPPQGPVFADPVPLPLTNGDGLTWTTFGERDRPPSITACDIDGDGRLDLFITAALVVDGKPINAVLLQREEQKFEAALDHPLAKVEAVNAALWGDYDNDGFTDVYLLRAGENQLWRQTAKNEWQDVTAATKTAGEPLDSVDGAIFDADHDGDLDLFIVNRDGPNELFNNNLDGTFRPIAKEQGIAGGGGASRQVVVADLDNDRDTDIIVINEEPPHEVYLNDRLWNYHVAPAFDTFRRTPLGRVVALASPDGKTRLMATGTIRFVSFWWRDDKGEWTNAIPPDVIVPDREQANRDRERRNTPDPEMIQSPWAHATLADVDGTGFERLIVSDATGVMWMDPDLESRKQNNGLLEGRGAVVPNGSPSPVRTGRHVPRSPREGSIDDAPTVAWIPVVFDSKGVSLVAYDSRPYVWRPGPARYPFAALAFTGKDDKGEQMRSNRSGVGVTGAARIGARWTAFHTFRHSSGPGQSLQPLAIGLGGAKRIDFVQLTWPDGVLQTEMQLEAGKLHVIEETQRQLASCPLVFVWDGRKYVFISDILGVGGIGFNVGRGEYGQPRPWENLLLPEGVLRPRDGKYEIKIGEPMEEVCYLDSARLVAYDLPRGWAMTIDDRFAINGPAPTGKVRFYRHAMPPSKATNDRGEDVTASVLKVDDAAAPVGELDRRFIGRLKNEHVLTLEFERPLQSMGKQGATGGSPASAVAADDALADKPPVAPASSPHLLLVIDGWIEYPYSQTMFAAWQAGATYDAPTLAARGEDGQWVTLIDQWGFPAGMPRQMSLPIPLDKLPSGCTALRLRTNDEIYWDRVMVALAEPCPQARRTELPLASCRVSEVGFAKRTTGPQRRPYYAYQHRAPLWDTRHQRGRYTRFGPADALVRDTDSAVAIIGPGEEVHLEFDAAPLAALTSDQSRRFVLETAGWCKDMDLYTKDGDTVAPLPHHDGATPEALRRRDALHDRFNTRYRAGH